MARTIASVDRQAPYLAYLGFACWMAWNTIAFSGSFWLHDITNSTRAENLILVHLIACVGTNLLVAAFSTRLSAFIVKNPVTIASGFVGLVGALLILVTRPTLLASGTLFNLGCVLTGVGTTLTVLRAASLFGSLPPHRTMYMLAACNLFSFMVYFVMDSCSNEVASALFALLPLASALLFCMHRSDTRIEAPFLHTHTKLPRQAIVFLLSIGLCSSALEFVHAYNLILLPPAFSVESTTSAQLVAIPLMLIVMGAILAVKHLRESLAKFYSVVIGALIIMLISISLFSLRAPFVAAINWVICACFNMTAWAIMFYIVFQLRANAIKLFSLGTAMLSGGTVLAGLAVSICVNWDIGDDVLKTALAVLGIVILMDALFVFSEKQINLLLVPIDDQMARSTEGEPIRKPGKWIEDCKTIAAQYHLSERETEVFISLARGRTAQEIADRDTLSIYTVRAHTRSIYAKLDVHSRKELVDFVESHRDKAPTDSVK